MIALASADDDALLAVAADVAAAMERTLEVVAGDGRATRLLDLVGGDPGAIVVARAPSPASTENLPCSLLVVRASDAEPAGDGADQRSSRGRPR